MIGKRLRNTIRQLLLIFCIVKKINKLKCHEKICKPEILMSSEEDNVLEFKQYMKSDKIPHINYADIESLIRKLDGCANNSDNSSTTNITFKTLHLKQAYLKQA